MSSSRGEIRAATSSCRTSGSGPTIRLEEVGHLAHEHRPRRLVGEDDVVVAVEAHEPRAADAGRRGGERGGTHSSGRRGCGSRASADRARAAATSSRSTCRCARETTAVSVSHARCCRSSSHRICSSVPPGIIMLLKTRRNSDVGRAHPTRISASNAASSSSSSGVAAASRARVAAVEDETRQALGMPGGVLDRHRAALRHRHEREPVEAGVLDDRLEVARPEPRGCGR